jgi:hypothetical protein
MTETRTFNKTSKQVELINMLAGPAKWCMAYGGSRSGKTFGLVYAMIVRAAKVKSRHVILRFKFNHVKTSVMLDTFPKVMSLCFPDLPYQIDKTDYVARFPNGSEIWFAGLDDKQRTEKILGKEYSTMYFNESSQLSYQAVLMAVTRLAEKNDLKKKLYFDCNPPTKSHWSYWLWERNFCPSSEEHLKAEEYASLLMNPSDNIDNLDSEYLSMLEKLPEQEKNRFLLGVYSDVDEGLAYYAFDRDRHIHEVTRKPGTIFCSMDFNVNPMTCTVFQVVDNCFHVFDEVYLNNSDTYRMAHTLLKRGYGGARIIPDSTAKNRKTSGKSDIVILRENGFDVMATHNPFVRDRVNNANRLFTADKIKINGNTCKKLIADLEQVAWKNDKLDPGPEKLLGHITDALTYGLWKLDKIDMAPNAKIRMY